MADDDGHKRGLIAALLIAAAAALPILAVFALSLLGKGGTWPANLPRLLFTTVQLCIGAGLISLIIGTVQAWLVTYYSFPGRKLLRWLALLPLALPGYIISFVYVETLTFAGPVQEFLRGIFGWTKPGDYWFPDIRSVGGAAFVMALALSPYVYLAGVTAFMRQPINQLHVARTLGRKPFRAFVEIALPQARPALFVGVLLVIMECVNDIGAATFFGIGTLTTAVYGVWLDGGDLKAAAQIASLLILFMGLLVWLETSAKARTLRDAKNPGHALRLTLSGWRGATATVAMAAPLLLGFVLPVIMLLKYSLLRWPEAFDAATGVALLRSLLLAGLAAIMVVIVALILAHLSRTRATPALKSTARFSGLGYALPGTVLGLGVLVPFGQLDQLINRMSSSWLGAQPGLILSGSVFALLFAYVTRFLIIGISQLEDGMNKIPTNMDHVARTLGRNRLFILKSIHLPLLRPAMIAAALLVFVDAMKELPATLILRPFDFDTLATHVFTLASLGQFESAAVPALLIVLAGLIPVFILSRGLKHV